MSLRTRFTDDLKTAMKAGDKITLETIRLMIAKMKEADVNARVGGKDIGDPEIVLLLQTMMKQRAESAKIYRDNARPELADREEAEMRVITTYLPAQLDAGAAAAAIAAIITELGAAGAKDMGRVMSAVKEKLAGQMDMSAASSIVKSKLAG